MHRQYFVIKLSVFSMRDVREKPNRQIPEYWVQYCSQNCWFYEILWKIYYPVFGTKYCLLDAVLTASSRCPSKYNLHLQVPSGYLRNHLKNTRWKSASKDLIRGAIENESYQRFYRHRLPQVPSSNLFPVILFFPGTTLKTKPGTGIVYLRPVCRVID